MAGLQLSGLASGFDWKTFTDSVMEMERAPARRYEAEQTKNDNKKSQLSSLGTKLSSLQSAMNSLASSSLAAGRKVVNESSSAVVQATVSSSTPVGTYEVQVTQLATASRLTGGVAAQPGATYAGTLNIKGTAEGEATPITITADMNVAAIVAAINNSAAGVTAIANKAGTQIVLTNQVTGAGNDIVDGGGGSNFLTGGAGADAFFLDGRFAVPVWSCITDWQPGEKLTLWGWRDGVSLAAWDENNGLPGFLGATLFADIDGNGLVETAITWTGVTKAELPTPVPFEVSGVGVYFFN